MGCGYSRIDTDVMKFCRERKHFIEASRDYLCSLSHVHKEYLQSLQNVDNEIRNFLGGALVVCFNSPLEAVLNHQNNKWVRQSKDSSSDSDVLSVTHFVHGGSDLSDEVRSLTDFVHGGLDLSDNENEIFIEEVSPSAFVQPYGPPKDFTSFREQPYNRDPYGFGILFLVVLEFLKLQMVGFLHLVVTVSLIGITLPLLILRLLSLPMKIGSILINKQVFLFLPRHILITVVIRTLMLQNGIF